MNSQNIYITFDVDWANDVVLGWTLHLDQTAPRPVPFVPGMYKGMECCYEIVAEKG
ncbi:hypothetical protein LJB99_00475 [Deltaproteobacteria bacterium OttesenSCG-928-K17]|nr:hypothetical protein [Deltaproteobacteria bacterium OttesenSCG-928-K17]